MSRSPHHKLVSNASNFHKGNGHSNQPKITHYFKAQEMTSKANSHFPHRNGQTFRQEMHNNDTQVSSNHRSPPSSPARSPVNKIAAKSPNGNIVHTSFQNGGASSPPKANFVNRSNGNNSRHSAQIPNSAAKLLEEHLNSERTIIQDSRSFSSNTGRECVFAEELGALQEDVERITIATSKRLSILQSLAAACGVVASPLSPSKLAARLSEAHSSSPSRSPSAHHRRVAPSSADECANCAPAIEPLLIYRLRGLVPPKSAAGALASSRKRVHTALTAGAAGAGADKTHSASATALKRSRSSQSPADSRPSGKFAPRKTAGNAATQPPATALASAEQAFDRYELIKAYWATFESEYMSDPNVQQLSQVANAMQQLIKSDKSSPSRGVSAFNCSSEDRHGLRPRHRSCSTEPPPTPTTRSPSSLSSNSTPPPGVLRLLSDSGHSSRPSRLCSSSATPGASSSSAAPAAAAAAAVGATGTSRQNSLQAAAARANVVELFESDLVRQSRQRIPLARHRFSRLQVELGEPGGLASLVDTGGASSSASVELSLPDSLHHSRADSMNTNGAGASAGAGGAGRKRAPPPPSLRRLAERHELPLAFDLRRLLGRGRAHLSTASSSSHSYSCAAAPASETLLKPAQPLSLQLSEQHSGTPQRSNTASVSESSVGEQIQSSLDLLQRVYASRSLRFIHLNTVRASTQTLNILPHADFLKQSRRRRLPLKGTRAVVALRRQDVSLWERRAAASPDAVRRSPLTAHPKCLTKSKSRSLRSLLSLVVPQTS